MVFVLLLLSMGARCELPLVFKSSTVKLFPNWLLCWLASIVQEKEKGDGWIEWQNVVVAECDWVSCKDVHPRLRMTHTLKEPSDISGWQRVVCCYRERTKKRIKEREKEREREREKCLLPEAHWSPVLQSNWVSACSTWCCLIVSGLHLLIDLHIITCSTSNFYSSS